MHFQQVAPIGEYSIRRSLKNKKITLPKLKRLLQQQLAVERVDSMTYAMMGESARATSKLQISDIYCDEIIWNEKGRQVIFIQEPEFIHTILNSKFQSESIKNLKPISESFVLALPKEATNPEGYEIRNALVTWHPNNGEFLKRNQHVINEALRSAGEDELPELPEVPDGFGEDQRDDALLQVMGCPEGMTIEEAYNQSVIQIVTSNSEGVLTKCIYEHDFKKVLDGDCSFSDLGSITIQTVFKLILGLAIYAAAGGNIEKGIPQISADKKRKTIFEVVGYETKVIVVNASKALKDENVHTFGHMRGFHFRNLVHPRYYQNEYANYPPKSRWCFVSAYWVGEKIGANTATDAEVGLSEA